jgi:hypothetical protein
MTLPFKHAEVKFFTLHYNAVITRTIEHVPISIDASREGPFSWAIDERGQPVQVNISTGQRQSSWQTIPNTPENIQSFAHRYLPTSRLYLGLQRPGSAVNMYLQGFGAVSEEELDKYFASSLAQLWTLYSAELLGAVRKAQEDGLASILQAVLTPGAPIQGEADLDPGVAFGRVASFLQRQGPAARLSIDQFISRYNSDPRLRSVVRDIDRVEQRIEEATAPRTKLQSLIQEMFSGGKVIRFEDQTIKIESGHQEDISLAMLSSGEKHILLLFVETLLAEQSSLIIDEPEISMHIDWQRKLIASMQQLNPSAQLIMASHSPEIMADVEDPKIFRL